MLIYVKWYGREDTHENAILLLLAFTYFFYWLKHQFLIYVENAKHQQYLENASIYA